MTDRNLVERWRDGGGPFRDPLAGWKPGVTVVLHPSTATIGRLLRQRAGRVGRMVSLTVEVAQRRGIDPRR